MAETLKYRTLFDRLFFSCELDVSKPDPRYFKTILATLDLPPEGVLFIDDVDANIVAAGSLGIRAELFGAASDPLEEMRQILSRYGITPANC
jgi:putative hydrolase of the HAD superfamily